MTLTMKAWFRAIAAMFQSEATAQAVAGLILLALVIYTGYTIPKPSMIGALKWISYINVSCLLLSCWYISNSTTSCSLSATALKVF